ncbi:hypothetical protein BOX15_Mlig024975g2 [Macrostomum lignano]|uniref:Lectin_legB domain-containing protein n=2 Tax=Macrostomum lignano TaxID=282301 RepID=A0A1I8GEQ3_9PLAT|nr:hypothetical protein BOX15_Mlig024975g2 [Macrostomum lignano]
MAQKSQQICLVLIALLNINVLVSSNRHEWQVSHELAIDYEHFTESQIIFRVLPANQTTAGDPEEDSTLKSAYQGQSQSCSGRGANLPYRDLLLSPAVLHLILASFRLDQPSSTNYSNSARSSARYLFFADDKRRGEGGQTSVWMADFRPDKMDINFDQMTNADAMRSPEKPFYMVHLCVKLLSRLRLPPEDSSEVNKLLNSPVLPLSIGASILSCLLLCLMLWSFASLTRRLRRYQESVKFVSSYQSAGHFGCNSCSSRSNRVRYNGSVSLLQNGGYSSIDARMEHERRMQQQQLSPSFYY